MSQLEQHIDTATLELPAQWQRGDATNDPDLLRKAEQELQEFKEAMNRNRAESGELLTFP